MPLSPSHTPQPCSGLLLSGHALARRAPVCAQRWRPGRRQAPAASRMGLCTEFACCQNTKQEAAVSSRRASQIASGSTDSYAQPSASTSGSQGLLELATSQSKDLQQVAQAGSRCVGCWSGWRICCVARPLRPSLPRCACAPRSSPQGVMTPDGCSGAIATNETTYSYKPHQHTLWHTPINATIANSPRKREQQLHR